MLELGENEINLVSGGTEFIIAMNYGEGANDVVITAERPSRTEVFFWGQMDNIKNEICNLPFEAAGFAIGTGLAKAGGGVGAAAGMAFGPAGAIVGYAVGYRGTQVAGAYVGRQVGGAVCSRWP